MNTELNKKDKLLIRLTRIKHKLLCLAEKYSDALVKLHNAVAYIDKYIENLQSHTQ